MEQNISSRTVPTMPESTTDLLIVKLPVPPSVNELTYNRSVKGKRGRAITTKYRKWLSEADKWLMLDNPRRKRVLPLIGRLSIEIMIPHIRGDASNRIKAAEDYLVSREITGDDKHNHKISIQFANVDCCIIRIVAL